MNKNNTECHMESMHITLTLKVVLFSTLRLLILKMKKKKKPTNNLELI